MADLIDKGKLKTAICIACSNGVIEIEGCASDDCKLQRLIDDQPTIEPEVRHGRWIPHFVDEAHEAYNMTNVFRCSECEKSVRFIMAYPKCEYGFCPHCGRKMDVGADNG